jgi:hypothetical protein
MRSSGFSHRKLEPFPRFAVAISSFGHLKAGFEPFITLLGSGAGAWPLAAYRSSRRNRWSAI